MMTPFWTSRFPALQFLRVGEWMTWLFSPPREAAKFFLAHAHALDHIAMLYSLSDTGHNHTTIAFANVNGRLMLRSIRAGFTIITGLVREGYLDRMVSSLSSFEFIAPGSAEQNMANLGRRIEEFIRACQPTGQLTTPLFPTVERFGFAFEKPTLRGRSIPIGVRSLLEHFPLLVSGPKLRGLTIIMDAVVVPVSLEGGEFESFPKLEELTVSANLLKDEPTVDQYVGIFAAACPRFKKISRISLDDIEQRRSLTSNSDPFNTGPDDQNAMVEQGLLM